MAKNYFKRYIWLIDLLNRRGYISLGEISDAWQKSPLNPNHSRLSERTFFNHRDAIFDIFGIEIKNDRTFGFYIANSQDNADSTAQWMLHTLCLNNVLQENTDMKDHILIENVPSGERYLADIISAMRAKRTISLTYQGFNRQGAHTFQVRAYCVKHFKQRWYMLGESVLSLRIYALDRIVDMEELSEIYEIPKEFDAAEYFNNYYGVIIDEDPVNVTLRVEPYQANYFHSLPLHHSQKEIEPADGWPVFTYHIAPTYDFIQEILSHGADIEVLSPESLRKTIKGIAAAMNNTYRKK